jgi:ABC-type multidrug transport system ATPase subunit
MLELQNISLAAPGAEDERQLLHEISARIPHGNLCAVLGPSGCGKSTLLKVIAGLLEPGTGSVQWEGRDLAEQGDLEPHEIGYVPQFSIVSDFLTVGESVLYALKLRVGGLTPDEQQERLRKILAQTRMEDIADRRVAVLSGGQKRRLALALELVTEPVLLLCDEVTSGLDPKAEDEVIRLLHQLSREENRVVFTVTHSLRRIKMYDSVIVLYDGQLAFHGAPNFLHHYFNIKTLDDLFPQLWERTADEWHASWQKHRAAYYATEHDAYQEVVPADEKPAEAPAYEEQSDAYALDIQQNVARRQEANAAPFQPPAALTQFATLLARRWLIFLRDKSQLLLQLALLFGFPCLVAIFAWDGLPEIQNLNLEAQTNILQQVMEQATHAVQSSRIGGLVSGLVMFQVVLLTLMGSNNAAREIAGERLIFEKEKFGGVRPGAYVASKAVFLTALVLAQSVWMGVFVNIVCHFPGDLFAQLGTLILVNAAMTAVCLGISSLAATPEQASLISVYLVGFQLPLSGAVLALPQAIGWITRPFTAAYWAWSGFLQTLRDTRFYDVVLSVSQTQLSSLPLCVWVLSCHIAGGLALAWFGSRMSKWK